MMTDPHNLTRPDHLCPFVHRLMKEIPPRFDPSRVDNDFYGVGGVAIAHRSLTIRVSLGDAKITCTNQSSFS